MKKLPILFSFIILFFSCEPEPLDPLPVEPQSNCAVELDVGFCGTFMCSDPDGLENISVELYEGIWALEEGAIALDTAFTNQNGWCKFYDLDCDQDYSVKIEFENHGTYYNRIRFGGLTNVSLDVVIVDNMHYDSVNVLAPVVKHINFLRPAVGQRSRFQYFNNSNDLSYNADPFYTNHYLNVSVMEQISTERFVVREHTPSIVKLNVWEITEDSLFVYPHNDEEIHSLVWGVTHLDKPHPSRYAFALNTFQSINILDMHQDFEIPIPEWIGFGNAINYPLFNMLFEDLMVHKQNQIDEGGQLEVLVYNKEYGPIRILNFLELGIESSRGYDLKLNE